MISVQVYCQCDKLTGIKISSIIHCCYFYNCCFRCFKLRIFSLFYQSHPCIRKKSVKKNCFHINQSGMRDSTKKYHCEKIFTEKMLQLFLFHYLRAFFCIQSIKLQFVNDQWDVLSAHEGQQWSDLCWKSPIGLKSYLKIQLILKLFSLSTKKNNCRILIWIPQLLAHTSFFFNSYVRTNPSLHNGS